MIQCHYFLPFCLFLLKLKPFHFVFSTLLPKFPFSYPNLHVSLLLPQLVSLFLGLLWASWRITVAWINFCILSLQLNSFSHLSGSFFIEGYLHLLLSYSILKKPSYRVSFLSPPPPNYIPHLRQKIPKDKWTTRKLKRVPTLSLFKKHLIITKTPAMLILIIQSLSSPLNRLNLKEK